MRFNITYVNPQLAHLRRDLMLVMKYGLEELGHQVTMTLGAVEQGAFNLVIGAYFLSAQAQHQVRTSGLKYAVVNTEIIANDMLNFNPGKTDFMGAYLPVMRGGSFIWDFIADNMPEHRRYGNNAQLFYWGYTPKFEEIHHFADKDVDAYFFGLVSPRRAQILEELRKFGLKVQAHDDCPAHIRNSMIERSKLILNLIQDDKYTHVNNIRIAYLANNRCAVLSEAMNDPAGYLDFTHQAERATLLPVAQGLVARKDYDRIGQEKYELFRQKPLKQAMEQLLDASFAARAA